MVTFVPGFVSSELMGAEAEEEKALAAMGPEPADTAERQRRLDEYRAAHPLPKATLAQVADHFDYVKKIVGPDHIGIGSDFDGIDEGPVGLEDVSKFPALFAELIRRGWSDTDLKKLAGENVLRVLRQAEGVAKRLRALRPPSVATIQELDK
jgi:membrane dipeptidase